MKQMILPGFILFLIWVDPAGTGTQAREASSLAFHMLESTLTFIQHLLGGES